MPPRLLAPIWIGPMLLVLTACSGPGPPSLPDSGERPPTALSSERSRVLHPLPVACQLRQGGGMLHRDTLIVAGLLLDAGCEDYEVGDDWPPPRPPAALPPACWS